VRVFLDTNVLASAAGTRGLCADVFREVLASHELSVSAQVIDELKRVLRSQFRLPQDLIDEFISLLMEDSQLASPGQLPKINIKDQDDLPILSAALSSRADVFVTGDKEILDLGGIQHMAILSPRQFWDKLKSLPRRRARRRTPRRTR
jgi:uncharacterized protein